MINKIDSLIGKLHDARLYGLLLDIEPKLFSLNVLLYVHLFSDFEDEKYSLEKALVVFECASIEKLSITNDLSNGQIYIIDYILESLGCEKFKFTFTFNDPSIELVLTAEKMKLVTSGVVEEKEDQLLFTNWMNLFK